MFEMLVRRGAAFLVDLIILVLIFYGNLQFIIASFTVNDNQPLGLHVMAMLIILQLIYIFIYFIYIPVRQPGQTIGKRLLKIKEVKLNGQDLAVMDYFKRDVLLKFLLSSMTSGFMIVLNAILLTYQAIRKQPLRAVQDMIMKTEVVKLVK